MTQTTAVHDSNPASESGQSLGIEAKLLELVSSLRDRFSRWLQTDGWSDPLEERLVSPLGAFLVALMAAALAAVPVFASLYDGTLSGLLLIAGPTGALLVSLLALFALRAGSFSSAVVVASWGMFLSASVIIVPFGHPANVPFLPVYLIAIIFAGLLGRSGHALALALSSVALSLLLIVVAPHVQELTELTAPRALPAVVSWWTFSLVTLIILASVFVIGGRLRLALTKAVDTAEALAQAQRGLEREVALGRAANHELRQRGKELQLLSTMADLLLASRSTEEAYCVIGDLLRQMFSVGVCRVFVVSETTAQLVASSLRADDQVQQFAADECWALRRGRSHRSDGVDHVACGHVGDEGGHHVCIPLAAYGETRAILWCTFPFESEQLEEELRRAHLIAEHLSLALANLAMRDELRQSSIRDPLTGLLNRRAFDEALARATRRIVFSSVELSLIFVDIDHFKAVNDTYGHDVGDEVLRRVASCLAGGTRGDDIVCRLGGEEFAIVLEGVSLEAAAARAETLRARVASGSHEYGEQRAGQLTVSLGVATSPTHGCTPDELFRAADQALYQAKRLGRNRVEIAEKPPAASTYPL